jgi:hypothetical protein
MRKTGSELTSEMVGPAGSTSDGAFSCWKAIEEDELWLLPELLADWPKAALHAEPAESHKTEAKRKANSRAVRNVMCIPACKSS